MGRTWITQDEWDRRADAVGLEWLDLVKNNRTPTAVRCLTCAHTWSPWPTGVTSGHGCPRCAGSAPLSQNVWDRRAAAVGIEWLEPVKASHTPTSARCLTCGHECLPRPANVQQGHGCPRCPRTPAIVLRFTPWFLAPP